MGFKEEMEEHDGTYRDTEVDDGTYAQLPDGTHQARLQICRVERKDWGWQWCLLWVGVNGNGSVWQNLNIDPEDEIATSILKKTAISLGYRRERLSELEEACSAGEFDGIVAEIYVKTKAGEKRDFTNTYVNKLLRREEDVPAVGVAASDDDIPF